MEEWNDTFLQEVTEGLDPMVRFIGKQYLREYIPCGGSKIKFLTGRPGSGKTHLARLLSAEAEKEGYVCVYFSASEIWMHDFREIYLEILRQSHLEEILAGCAHQIIREMGYDPEIIPPGKIFMDYLLDCHEADALSKGEIRSLLRSRFTHNPLLDNLFAGSCSLLVGGLLGHPFLESGNQEILLSFLHGDKTVKLSQIRALGLSPSRITRYNARHMLRSLSEVIRMSGKQGLFIVIDDLEVLLNRSSGEMNRYTKLRREDTYESIRQLIDDIDSMRYLMFVMCFDRELMDNESYGLKSYQALWMRIQNEVVGEKFNYFSDILDLDRLADQIYTPQALVKMSEKICRNLQAGGHSAEVITQEQARELIRRAEYGGLGLPCLVNRAVLEGKEFLNGQEVTEHAGF